MNRLLPLVVLLALALPGVGCDTFGEFLQPIPQVEGVDENAGIVLAYNRQVQRFKPIQIAAQAALHSGKLSWEEMVALNGKSQQVVDSLTEAYAALEDGDFERCELLSSSAAITIKLVSTRADMKRVKVVLDRDDAGLDPLPTPLKPPGSESDSDGSDPLPAEFTGISPQFDGKILPIAPPGSGPGLPDPGDGAPGQE